ncbi:MAG: dihydrolipoyl dehydrogenase [Eubacteriales bacterium]
MTDFDLMVIGAGPGGYTAALKAAQLGLRTAVIENSEVGGTCLNRGCIPTKTLLHAAELLHELKNGDEFGISAEHVTCDIDKLYQRKNEVVSQLRGGIEFLFQSKKVELIRGTAKILGAGVVLVDHKEYSCSHMLIATGSVPSIPPIPGANLPGVVTSDHFLAAEGARFQKLVILGGGVIGMEFATICNFLGSNVTVIEAESRILPNFDREISQNLSMILKKRGVEILTGALAEKIEDTGGLTMHYTQGGKSLHVGADCILIATGRRANTAGLLSEGVDLQTERGQIPVNSSFESCIKGIYAIGDVIRGGVQLAHAASAQGINAVHAMCGKTPPVNLHLIPSCVYTTPEIACVGLSEEQAKKSGLNVKTGKHLMSANGKSVLTGADRGFVKLVIDGDTDRIIGAQLMCSRATDMIAELSLAIANGLTREQLASVIHPHPTFSEGIFEAAEHV